MEQKKLTPEEYAREKRRAYAREYSRNLLPWAGMIRDRHQSVSASIPAAMNGPPAERPRKTDTSVYAPATMRLSWQTVRRRKMT